MDKRVVVFGLFSVTVLTGTVVACSTTVTSVVPDPGTVDGGDGGGKKEGGGGGNDSGGGNPDDACGEEATKQACGQCCVTNHPTGYKTFENALLGCACTGEGSTKDAGAGAGPCKADCATTLCASTPANGTPACNTCVQNSVGANGACNMHVGTECQADQDCVDEQACVGQCQSKP